MALVQDSTGYYLEPSTGQYYSPYTAPARSYGYFGSPISSFGNQQAYTPPAGLMNFDNKQYVPFTGSAVGISQGKRSVVDALVGGRQPYQYNVPSLAEMFPSLQMQAPMQGNMQMQDPSFGAGRFMGGLLGAMPTPVSSTTMQAPSSSGAGRFL